MNYNIKDQKGEYMYDYLKKYWFVALVAIFMFVFTIGYSLTSAGKKTTNTIKNKVVNNESVIYELNGQSVTASQLYDDANRGYSNRSILNEITKLVTKYGVDTDKEIKHQVAGFKNLYLRNGNQAKILSEIRRFGYTSISDLEDYLTTQFKVQKLNREFLHKHQDDLVKPFIEKNPGKIYAHILIKVKDVKKEGTGPDAKFTLNPTQEEKDKLKKVQERIKNEAFEKVASEMSEDPGSKRNGGSLGYVTDNDLSKFVKPFAQASAKLKGGEISEVVESEFGYHIIKAYKNDIDSLINNPVFISTFFQKSNTSSLAPIVEKAKELKIEIQDEKLKANFNNLVNKGAR